MKKYLLTIVAISMTLATLSLAGCEKEDEDAIKMSDVNKGVKTDSLGNEYVDLGTPGIYWAKCNIGDKSPEEAGSFFSWGEIEAKNAYNSNNYKWGDYLKNSSITKYNIDRDYGNVDNKTVLDPEDDAAKAILGEGWSIPTSSNFKWLFTKTHCESKWCKLNGVSGFLFTSVMKGYEGNSIFIPLAGMIDNNTKSFNGQYGWYWCNSLYTDKSSQTHVLEAAALWLEHLDNDNTYINARPRTVGQPIRPVYKKTK